MLSTQARARLAIVLVGARNPQNIGAAARAMRDFGFSDLRVVNSFAPPFEAAQLEASSAVAADDVMRSARLYGTLEEAIADCGLIAGTTAIGGRDLARPVLPLREAANQLGRALIPPAETPEPTPSNLLEELGLPWPLEGRAPCSALLFGSEKTGLTTEQLSHCSLLMTIPMFAPEGRHLSMNLGQAVAVCLYELVREGFEGARDLPESTPVHATDGDRERLLALLLDLMERSDYARRFPANARPHVVRQMVGQLARTQDEAVTWMGLLKMTLRSMDSHAVSLRKP